jgi:hypothetical protein
MCVTALPRCEFVCRDVIRYWTARENLRIVTAHLTCANNLWPRTTAAVTIATVPQQPL